MWVKCFFFLIVTLIFCIAKANFGIAAASHFTSVLVNQNHRVGPNALIIISALATEFIGSLPIGPPELLSGFAIRLIDCLREYIFEWTRWHCLIYFKYSNSTRDLSYSHASRESWLRWSSTGCNWCREEHYFNRAPHCSFCTSKKWWNAFHNW